MMIVGTLATRLGRDEDDKNLVALLCVILIETCWLFCHKVCGVSLIVKSICHVIYIGLLMLGISIN